MPGSNRWGGRCPQRPPKRLHCGIARALDATAAWTRLDRMEVSVSEHNCAWAKMDTSIFIYLVLCVYTRRRGTQTPTAESRRDSSKPHWAAGTLETARSRRDARSRDGKDARRRRNARNGTTRSIDKTRGNKRQKQAMVPLKRPWAWHSKWLLESTWKRKDARSRRGTRNRSKPQGRSKPYKDYWT